MPTNDEIIKNAFSDLVGAIADDWAGVRKFMQEETGDYTRIDKALNLARTDEGRKVLSMYLDKRSKHGAELRAYLKKELAEDLFVLIYETIDSRTGKIDLLELKNIEKAWR